MRDGFIVSVLQYRAGSKSKSCECASVFSDDKKREYWGVGGRVSNLLQREQCFDLTRLRSTHVAQTSLTVFGPRCIFSRTLFSSSVASVDTNLSAAAPYMCHELKTVNRRLITSMSLWSEEEDQIRHPTLITSTPNPQPFSSSHTHHLDTEL